MKKSDLFKRMSDLEAANEGLINEIYETDQIMRRIGFSDGLTTVKAVAYDMFKQRQAGPSQNKELID